NIKRQPRLGTKLVMRRRFVRHPRRYAGYRPVGLRNNDQFSTTVGVLPGNEHDLAAPGMKRVVNPPLDRVLAGSMSLLRAAPGSHECRSSARAGAWRSSAVAYADGRACRSRPSAPRRGRPGLADAASKGLPGSD